MALFSLAALEHNLHYADYERVMQTGIDRKVERGSSFPPKSCGIFAPAQELRDLRSRIEAAGSSIWKYYKSCKNSSSVGFKSSNNPGISHPAAGMDSDA
jgi:hypothetical protein